MNIQKNYTTKDGGFSPIGQNTTLAQFRIDNLAVAKAYYQNRRQSTDGMSDDEILIRSIVDRYRELRDDWFKLSYLSYLDMARFDTSAKESNKKGPIAIFAALMPNCSAARLAEVRTDRRVAALRIIEALRMHAASTGGTLPESLDEIKLVPIPLDPMTGKPFSYTRAGETATLSAPPPKPGHYFIYRITLKK